MVTRSEWEWDTLAFMRELRRTVKRMEDSAEKSLYHVGIKTVANIKRRTPVDTGRLRSSYGAVPGHDGLGPYVDVGTTLYYAGFVEYGTIYQRPQPHFRPGIVAAREFVGDEVARWVSAVM